MPIIREGTNVFDPDVKPGLHRDHKGNIRPPVGTLGEMLFRAQSGEPRDPFPGEWVETLCVTLDDPDIAAAIVVTLRPALEKLFRRSDLLAGRDVA